MTVCDRCGNLAVLLAPTEAATLNEHGEPQHGRLCHDCWPDDWEWPFGRGEEVDNGG